MDATRERLFTPRFFLMCGFSFAVFFSAFQLFPTAPFRIRDLGGDTFAAGLFLACLTFASAVSAPFTGAMADRFGLRRTLRVGGVALTVFSVGYAVLPDYRLMLGADGGARRVLVGRADGVGGLHDRHPAANAAGRRHRATGASRRWSRWPSDQPSGSGSISSAGSPLCAVMGALNLVVAVIAWRLPKERPHPPQEESAGHGPLIEWRVLVLSATLMLYSYGYGAITSFAAMYAEASGVDAERPLSDRRRPRDHRHEAVSRPDRRPRRVRPAARAVPRADLRRAARARRRRRPAVADTVGRHLRHRLRHGVPGLCRVSAAARGRRPPRRGLRRPHRRLRHRDRHRFARHGLDRRRRGLPGRLRRRPPPCRPSPSPTSSPSAASSPPAPSDADLVPGERDTGPGPR